MRALLLLALVSAPAFADDDDIPLPKNTTAQAVKLKPFDVNSATPPEGCDHDQLLSWFKNYRESQRKAAAMVFVKNAPKAPGGAKCIQNDKAFYVTYDKSANLFHPTCLAEEDGDFTTVIRWDLAVPMDQSVNDTAIENWISSKQCQWPQGTRMYFEQFKIICLRMIPNQLQSSGYNTYAVDHDYYEQLAAKKPEVRAIIDGHLRVIGESSRKTKKHHAADSEDDGDFADTRACARSPLGCRDMFGQHNADDTGGDGTDNADGAF